MTGQDSVHTQIARLEIRAPPPSPGVCACSVRGVGSIGSDRAPRIQASSTRPSRPSSSVSVRRVAMSRNAYATPASSPARGCADRCSCFTARPVAHSPRRRCRRPARAFKTKCEANRRRPSRVSARAWSIPAPTMNARRPQPDRCGSPRRRPDSPRTVSGQERLVRGGTCLRHDCDAVHEPGSASRTSERNARCVGASHLCGVERGMQTGWLSPPRPAEMAL